MEKQRAARQAQVDAEQQQFFSIEGERNISHQCTLMICEGRLRGEALQKISESEHIINSLAEKLRTYKIEIANLETLAVRLRKYEAQLENAYYEYDEKAVEAERLAQQAEQELSRLKDEVRSMQLH